MSPLRLHETTLPTHAADDERNLQYQQAQLDQHLASLSGVA